MICCIAVSLLCSYYGMTKITVIQFTIDDKNGNRYSNICAENARRQRLLPCLIHTFLTCFPEPVCYSVCSNRPRYRPPACGGHNRSRYVPIQPDGHCRGADHGRDQSRPKLYLCRAQCRRSLASARYGDRPRYRRRCGHFLHYGDAGPAEGAHRGAGAVYWFAEGGGRALSAVAGL